MYIRARGKGERNSNKNCVGSNKTRWHFLFTTTSPGYFFITLAAGRADEEECITLLIANKMQEFRQTPAQTQQ